MPNPSEWTVPERGGTVAVLGGTGALGSALARRWAAAGLPILLGSRDPLRAAAAAEAMNVELGTDRVRAGSYRDTAAAAEIAVLAVPFAAQGAILREVRPLLAGKVLVDCTVPLRPPAVGKVQLPAEGSAAQIAQHLLGDGVRVVSAFHNVSAALLREGAGDIACDVLVCSDDGDARKVAIAMAQAAGLRGIAAGPLANSAAAEALTSVLISINRSCGVRHAGIRITGLPDISA